MTQVQRKQAEILIKRNELAIRHAARSAGQLQDASRRSNEALESIRASLKRAHVLR